MSVITLRTFIRVPLEGSVSVKLSCKELAHPESGLLVEFSAWEDVQASVGILNVGVSVTLLFSSGLEDIAQVGLPSLSLMGREIDT